MDKQTGLEWLPKAEEGETFATYLAKLHAAREKLSPGEMFYHASEADCPGHDKLETLDGIIKSIESWAKGVTVVRVAVIERKSQNTLQYIWNTFLQRIWDML